MVSDKPFFKLVLAFFFKEIIPIFHIWKFLFYARTVGVFCTRFPHDINLSALVPPGRDVFQNDFAPLLCDGCGKLFRGDFTNAGLLRIEALRKNIGDPVFQKVVKLAAELRPPVAFVLPYFLI